MCGIDVRVRCPTICTVDGSNSSHLFAPTDCSAISATVTRLDIEEDANVVNTSAKTLIGRRGPDSFRACRIAIGHTAPKTLNDTDPDTTSWATIDMFGSVLHMRGTSGDILPDSQPLISDQGNVLVWNGEVFGGEYKVSEGQNDTHVVFDALNQSTDVVSVMSSIEGPFAFVYWQQSEKTLWYGRDMIGRRSLVGSVRHRQLPDTENEKTYCEVALSSVGYADEDMKETAATQVRFASDPSPPPSQQQEQEEKQKPEPEQQEAEPQSGGSNSDSNSSYEGWSEVATTGIFCMQFALEDIRNQEKCEIGEERQVNQADDRKSVLTSQYQSVTCRLVQYPWEHTRTANTGLQRATVASQVTHSPMIRIEALPYTRPASEEGILSGDSKAIEEAADILYSLLSDAVRERVLSSCQRVYQEEARIGILFSGGIDCTVLAALAAVHLPPEESIDLINVVFIGEETDISKVDSSQIPDRATGINGYLELQQRFPSRSFRLIEVNVSLLELEENRSHISQLIHPSDTIMDFNIGAVMWFGARGTGIYRTSLTHIESEYCRYIEEKTAVSVEQRKKEKAEERRKQREAKARERETCLPCSISVGDSLEAIVIDLYQKKCALFIEQLNIQATSNPPSHTTSSKENANETEKSVESVAVFYEDLQLYDVVQVTVRSVKGIKVFVTIDTIKGRLTEDQVKTYQENLLFHPNLSQKARKKLEQLRKEKEEAEAKKSMSKDDQNNHKPNSVSIPTQSSARVLLVGIGADEQMAGYGRHRTVFRHGGIRALENEIELDCKRLWKRNLGRDDRIISDHSREARHPFLAEPVVSFLSSLPMSSICDLSLPTGVGDKMILRRVAQKLGLNKAGTLQKRAIQFGSRIANQKVPGTVKLNEIGSLRQVVNPTYIF